MPTNNPAELNFSFHTHHNYGKDSQGKDKDRRKTGDQLDHTGKISDYYYPGSTRIKSVVVTLPDPRIPRLKRDFDLTVSAISAAFSKNEYSLDRYYFPWEDDGPHMQGLATPEYITCYLSNLKDFSTECNKIESPNLSTDFGVITYRKDLARNCDSSRPCDQQAIKYEVIAVYIVGERPTTGVPVDSLTGAILHASMNATSDQENTPNPIEQLVKFIDEELIIIGPTYSGSVQSVMAVNANFKNLTCSTRINPKYQNICSDNKSNETIIKIVSPTATALTNQKIAKDLEFMAINDSDRVMKIEVLAQSKTNGICLQENSTYGEQFNCPFDFKVRFPPSIWEVGLSYQAGQSEESEEIPNILAGSAELQFGRDFGNELPAHYAPDITGRTQELQIDKLASLLSNAKNQIPIRYVVLVASDVRDRLFLSRFTKNYLPNSQLIFIESDILLSHPSYIDATRGAWMISGASLNLTSKELEDSKNDENKYFKVFSTETSAQFFKALNFYLQTDCLKNESKKCQFTSENSSQLNTYIVSRAGFRLSDFNEDYDELELVLIVLLFNLLMLILFMALPRLKNHEKLNYFGEKIERLHNPTMWFWIAALVLFAVFIIFASDFFTHFTLIHSLIISNWFLAIYFIRPWSRQTNGSSDFIQLIFISIGLLITFLITHDSQWSKFLADGVRATDAFFVAIFLIILSTLSIYRKKEFVFTVSTCVIILMLLIINLFGSEILFWHPINSFQGRLAFCSITVAVIVSLSVIVKTTYTVSEILKESASLSYQFSQSKNIDIGCTKDHYLSPIMAKFHSTSRNRNIDPFILNAHQNLAEKIIYLRRELLLCMLSPLSIVLMVYLTPVYEQNNFLMIGLGLLVYAAAFCCFSLIQIDGNPFLRQLFCVKDSKTTIGVKIFAMVLFPVILVAIGLAIAFIPGVAVWTDGFLMKLINVWLH